MIAPVELEPDLLLRGESYTPAFQPQDADGAPLDLSAVATVTAQLRLKHRAAGTVELRTYGAGAPGGEAELVTIGGTAYVRFLFTKVQTAALTLGLWDLEFTYQDAAAAPAFREVQGHGTLTVQDPATGTLP